jgi:hypothetical protein
VIIGDLDVKSVPAFEPKAEPPLIVDPDRILARTIADQGFQPVGARWSQILKLRRRMQLGKPHQRSSQNIARQPPAFAGGEKLFGLGIGNDRIMTIA